ncbi:efflux RND transporter periplasmic adaptor subunit [candidate division FCPU426 bacterium]|nr:efflux RND transporter periplasmic adaptor subunit [candidate division FCPU426 bacterium]
MHKVNPLKPIIAILVLSGLGGLVWWLTQPGEFLYAGTIEATEVLISSRVASVIDAIRVKEGEAVQAGQPLMTLSGEDMKLAADLAAKEYKRGKELLASGALNQSQVDKLKGQRDQTALLVDWCTITAPRAGKVLESYREAGEMVAPGMPLFNLGDLSEVYAFIYVEQPKLAKLAVGQTVEGLLPEMPDKSFPGTLVLIRDEAEFTPKNVQTRSERTRLVYGVKVVFANPAGILKPGMTIEVRLPKE